MAPMQDKSDRFKRGSRPPYMSLADAFALARDIYDQGGGRATRDLMSRIIKNSSSSSSFTKKTNAFKAYGLATEDQDSFVLTPDGLAIAAPTEPALAAEAKKTALLNIDIFARVYERHKGKLLPADEFLKNIIEQELGIPRELSSEWVDAVKDSMKAAGLLYDRGDGKMQIMESPIIRFPRTSTSASAPPLTDIPPPKETSHNGSTSTAAALGTTSGHNTRIALSQQRFAVFSIPDSLTVRDAQKIKSAINGISAIVDSMVDEDQS